LSAFTLDRLLFLPPKIVSSHSLVRLICSPTL